MPMAIVLAHLTFYLVEPISIPLQPVASHGLEHGGPEPEMGGAVSFACDWWQARPAAQGLGRKHLGDPGQSQADSGNPPFPPPVWDTIVIQMDQRHGDEPAVAVGVYVDTGVAIAEERPVAEPICAAIYDSETKFFEEAERLLYLPSPPVCPWYLKRRHFPI
jgi:hypothetical protein